jgi:secondary thiamine-phosphate synthase enzyme
MEAPSVRFADWRIALPMAIATIKNKETMVKSHTDYLVMSTPQRKELVNITDEIAEFVDQSAIQEGMVLVSAMHITAGVFVNDEESGLKRDILKWVEHLAPADDYEHHKTGEDNGDAHLKRLLVHHQVILPITKGKLDLGPWEQVFYAEFDGQRKKRIILKAIGE